MNNLDNIKEIIEQSPSSSGIYKMLNEKEEIMYVGKAKNLQNRLKSYLNTNNLSNRIRRMVSRISNIEVIITETEKEALLLEANLIKKLKPPFNILYEMINHFLIFLLIMNKNFHKFQNIEENKNIRENILVRSQQLIH